MIASQVCDYIIVPALKKINLHSDFHTKLLLGTCAQESKMGIYIHQLGNGPALGIFQIEPKSHDDLWINFIEKQEHQSFKLILDRLYPNKPNAEQMIWDMQYAAIMARIFYLRALWHDGKEVIPEGPELDVIWDIYKTHFNTKYGKATKTEFFNNYRKYVG